MIFMQNSTPADNDIKITILHLAEVDSTNTYTKDHCNELPDAALVYADIQTAGRGRLDRKWISEKGNFFGTLLLKKLANPFLGTMVVSLAALDALKKLAPEAPVWLKWPNDLYIDECKVAGILSETTSGCDGERCIAVGLGVNLNLSAEKIAAIDKPAACVGNGKINPEKFASELAIYAKMYYIMGIAHSGNLFDLWRKRNDLVGMDLMLELGNQQVASGTAIGIAPDGALIMRDAQGLIKNYYCGDVSVNRQSVRRALEQRKRS